MWCDVSQVSFARGFAHRSLSLTLARRGRSPSFFLATPYPLRARVCAPPYVRSLLSACTTRVPRFRVSRRSWRAGYVIARRFSALQEPTIVRGEPTTTRVFCRRDFNLLITTTLRDTYVYRYIPMQSTRLSRSSFCSVESSSKEESLNFVPKFLFRRLTAPDGYLRE